MPSKAEARIDEALRTGARSLNLSHLGLRNLPESLGNLTALTDLQLDDNDLTVLPKSLANLTDLTRLDLCNNSLTKLPESLGNLTALADLDLRRNAFTALPDWAAQVAVHDARAISAGCPIDCLSLPASSVRPLTRAHGVTFDPPRTVGDVARLYEQHRLDQIKGLGPRRMSRIAAALTSAGLTTRTG